MLDPFNRSSLLVFFKRQNALEAQRLFEVTAYPIPGSEVSRLVRTLLSSRLEECLSWFKVQPNSTICCGMGVNPCLGSIPPSSPDDTDDTCRQQGYCGSSRDDLTKYQKVIKKGYWLITGSSDYWRLDYDVGDRLGNWTLGSSWCDRAGEGFICSIC